jgi:hypothetical protein
MKKETISIDKVFDNVKRYSALQLAEFISMGEFTYDELVKETDGDFDEDKRRNLESLLNTDDYQAWCNAQSKNSQDALQNYLDSFPKGLFRNAASEALEDLNPVQGPVSVADIQRNAEELVNKIHGIENDNTRTLTQKVNSIIDVIRYYINNRRISKEVFLSMIGEDHNLLSSGVVKRLIDERIITVADLSGIGIDGEIISQMNNVVHSQPLPQAIPFDRIKKQSTEIYFWGIPSSGKSCALGAILSAANSGIEAKTMRTDKGSKGIGYMTRLMNLFHNGEVGALMEGTPINSFYEMGFDLVDQDNNIHPITCIDMAGELMRCMYKSIAQESMTEQETTMLDTLTNVLIHNRSEKNNRKIHFFVIEYGAENKLFNGLPQSAFLDGVVTYLQDTPIFENDTDAIYILITKADRLKGASTQDFIKYIKEKYLGFYNGLGFICDKHNINGGKVEMIAFSLGDVCFQNYCKFDARCAKNVVKIIISRTAYVQGGIIGFIKKLFKN